MLVDDDVEQLYLRACVATAHGYEVIATPDPFLAIRLGAKEKFDLAILDYEMPGMNGCTLADKLRETAPALKIALYSGVVAIPENDIQKVDLFISKADGIFDLLCRLSELLKHDCQSITSTPRWRL
jgi:two-component system KDP operon response regulator KdpE